MSDFESKLRDQRQFLLAILNLISGNEAACEYIYEIADKPALTPDKESKLLTQLKAGGRLAAQARKSLIESNLKLVVLIAADKAADGEALMDLIQEGNLALIQAAETFDPKGGQDFGSHARALIASAISRASAQEQKAGRLPAHVGDSIKELLKVTRTLAHKAGRKPTCAEIADAMQIDEDRLREIVRLARESTYLKPGEDGAQELLSLAEELSP